MVRRLVEALVLGLGFSTFTAAADQSFSVNGHGFDVVGDLGGFELDIDQSRADGDVALVTIRLTSLKPAVPPQFSVKWSIPSVDVAGIWTPAFNESHILPADWSSAHLESMATRNAPVFTLFGHDDVNRLTVALSDAMNFVKLSARIREEDARIHNMIEFFTEPHQALSTYSVTLRVDERGVGYGRSLADVADWWAAQDGYEPTFVPEDAKKPMYSTWYSYHQDIEHEALISEVKLAAKMGFEAIIVDDGWQTNDSNRGYAYTGDWNPERLTEMRRFTDEVHAEGMKALLWYSLPFVGEQSEAVTRFEGKFLAHRQGLGAYVLDPRYPEVREFLIDHYLKAVRDWGWDGLKLDFIDQFRADENTDLTLADGRDYASVYEAVDRLMTDTLATLQRVNPNVMIEFRQRYIGPLMRKYGNMFRATDIPNGAVTNRFRIANLRLLSGDTAVHSDMIMWHKDEPVEIAALQLLNVLFSVPQVSVKLADIPQDHFEMIRFYTDYWNENRDIFLDGEFEAKDPIAKFPIISGKHETKQIFGLYGDRIVEVVDPLLTALDIVNAKKSGRVVLAVGEDMGQFTLVIRNSVGKVIDEHKVTLGEGVHSFTAPVSGVLSFKR
ncbi:glycoside hydrolase family 36 protein [Kordiimonas sp.]|uniref:glycoside hydrolase family 36 protein n=1 Tax=Kordiimonas sp. TaxID=1970157 RepID=UPI003A8EA9CF